MNRLFLSLSFLMGAIILASNYLVQFPIKYYGFEEILTYGAFSYPIAFLITDLANRTYGKLVARKIVYIGFIIGICFTLLFSTNFLFIWSLFSLFNGSLIYLIPIFIKALADFFLSIVFMAKVKRHWSLVSYAILTVMHPFYMIIIGTLGPFVRVNWKKSMI